MCTHKVILRLNFHVKNLKVGERIFKQKRCHTTYFSMDASSRVLQLINM
jgi:hypothetical protein